MTRSGKLTDITLKQKTMVMTTVKIRMMTIIIMMMTMMLEAIMKTGRTEC